MPHFQGQHDAQAEPTRLHEADAEVMEDIRSSLRRLHEKFDALVARLDAPAPESVGEEEQPEKARRQGKD